MICVAMVLSTAGIGSMSTMRFYRKRFGLHGLAQVHHVIPKEHRHHRALTAVGYNIDDRRNLVFLPTLAGAVTLALHHDRPCHENGHVAYNAYVHSLLDETNDVNATLLSLRQSMRHLDVPWR